MALAAANWEGRKARLVAQFPANYVFFVAFLARIFRNSPPSPERNSPVRLKNKVALVTGGGRGIGRDIALAYAREGAHVVINDVDPATAAQTAKDAAALGSNSLAVVADVAKAADITRLVDTIIKERGRIDIVVNNAMKIVPGKLERCRKKPGTPP